MRLNYNTKKSTVALILIIVVFHAPSLDVKCVCFFFRYETVKLTKIASCTPHCHDSVTTATTNKRLANLQSANDNDCVLWRREWEEVGFADVASLLEEVGFDIRVTRQQTQSTIPHPRKQNKRKKTEKFERLLVFSIVSFSRTGPA